MIFLHSQDVRVSVANFAFFNMPRGNAEDI